MSDLKQKKVLLTGTYSSFNKGDLAMQITAAKELQQEECKVSIDVPFPQYDNSTYNNLGVNPFKSDRRKLLHGTLDLINLKFLGFKTKYNKHFYEADIIVDLSGDMLTEDYGIHVAYSHFIPLLKACILKKPYTITAQSVGPFKHTKKLASYVLKNASHITVRDPISKKYLDDMGVKSVLTADLAFLLPYEQHEKTKQIFSDIQKQSEGKSILGVSMSELVANNFGNPKTFKEIIAKSLDEICHEHNLFPVFYSHVTGPNESKDDRNISEEIAQLMKEKSFVVEQDLHSSDIKFLISKSRFFIGARMHANMAALSTGVPLIAISYSHKTSGIMTLFGLKKHVIDSKHVSISNLTALFYRLVENEAVIKNQIESKLGSIKTQAKSNIHAIIGEIKQ